MNSEQQRAVDQAIIDGRLVDAIAAYRSATGVGLAEAEQYVRRRSGTFTASGTSSSSADVSAPASAADSPWHVSVSQALPTTSGTLSSSAVKKIVVLVGVIVVASVVIPLLFTAGALFVTFRGLNLNPFNLTHSLATFATITHEPYYPDLVKQIQIDPHFKAALGTPIVVDDGEVACSYIHDDSVQHKANCTIPVRGPKATGIVRVQVVVQAGSMDLGAWLHVGDRTIPINS